MRTLVFSDLHGQYRLWEQIKNYIKPDDKVFCLGDTIDRGYCGLQILKEIFEMSNITLIKGNHEDFISQIGPEVIKEMTDENYYDFNGKIWLWRCNGGDNTIEDFKKLSLDEQFKLINKVNKLPTHAEYINKKGDIIYLCHAGRDKKSEERDTRESYIIETNSYIWDRRHIYHKWDGENNEYCVHGHTPVCFMDEYVGFSYEPPVYNTKIYHYCNGHKIDIDLGSFRTGVACILNLDTFEAEYFYDKEVLNKNE